ncbi:MAG: hypothetical protein IPP48_01355 [Chitinophagaceae bacterium]|nr:hypothetical protein [Chitinophagaceae bacterium]
MAFHVKNQPNNIWHIKLKLKDGVRPDRVLEHYNFKTLGNNAYYNEVAKLYVILNTNELLLSYLSIENSSYATETATDLFIQKNFIPKETLSKLVNAKSHLSILLLKNIFLPEDAIVKGNFDKEKIDINTTFIPNPAFNFTESDFAFSSNNLLTLQFTQPPNAVYNLLSISAKEKINKALNFSIDSMLLPGNKSYQLHLTNFITRADSAISYTYDDEFNKIEKVVVNNVQEPAYTFTITGDSVNKIYNYWQNTKIIEQTANGNLFTSMPFVKSYCTANSNQLAIQPQSATLPILNENFKGILNFRFLLSKMPPNLLKYLPNTISGAISNVDEIKLSAQNSNASVKINCTILKKKNSLSIVKF